MTTHFFEKLTSAIESNQSLLCVGLDPDPHKYSAHFPSEIDAKGLAAWGQTLIEQTSDLVCCYKPNAAFYEQYGAAGWSALQATIAAVPDHIPVLLDAKRGDMGNTAIAYARAVFEALGADAVTLNPYLGQDGVAPFLAYPGKAVFLLCHTSNPSAQEIQTFADGERQLYEHVVQVAQRWDNSDRVGFVVGATQPHALTRFRQLNDTHWILAPGVGTQGGDLSATLQAGLNSTGNGLIIPVSRAIIYNDDPRAATQSLRDMINQTRSAVQPIQAQTPHTDLILQLHEVGCVQFGEFTLSSGQQSPIYIDLRRSGASGLLLQRAARAYADILHQLSFDHIAGVPYAALPIGTAVALEMNGSLVYPRKEVKQHGTGRTVEGVFSTGDRAVVIEDVVTSGGSVLTAIQALEQAGLIVSDAVVLIDRQQGGEAALIEKGYQFHAALTIREILAVLQQAGRISADDVANVQTYLAM